MNKNIVALLIVIVALTARGSEPNQWALADDEKAGSREQHLLVYSPALKKAVLLAGVIGAGTTYVMAFNPESRAWEALSDARPVGRVLPLAAATDVDGKNIFVFTGDQLHRFNVETKKWDVQGEPLKNCTLAAFTMGFDPVNNGLVLLGSETALDKAGWMGGMFHSLSDGKWHALTFGEDEARKTHEQRRKVLSAVEELVGTLRHTWYRDPKGEGTDAERTQLTEYCTAIKKLPAVDELTSELDKIAGLVGQKNLLEALKTARGLHRKFEELTEATSPVPPARRHSPVVCDPVDKALLLFGGDHEDYTTNDTWILDLKSRNWHRAKPKIAPSPRCSHGLAWLPSVKKAVLWDGFHHNSNTDYRGFQAALLPQREVWLYDVPADKWELASSWPNTDKTLPYQMGEMGMGFFGYASQPFPMALAADDAGRLIAVGGGTKKQGSSILNSTWVLTVDGKADASAKNGAPANSRDERTGPYLASFSEDAAAAAPIGIDNLPANTWTQLPPPPRKPYSGKRLCDYGTAVWNPDADEILHWGGGHCDSSTSVVSHRSLISNRAVLAYDLDEPYSINGGGPWPHSLMGRPWVGTHAYKSYGYDSKNKVMVLLRAGVGNESRLYDPVGMRWLVEACRQPFDGHDYTAHVISTTEGAVAWAGTSGYMGVDGRGLWLLDRKSGWKEMAKPGTAPRCDVDVSCSCYDCKRDRVLLMPGGQDGAAVYSCSMKGGAIEKINPANPGFGKIARREAVYVEHCDWVLLVQTLVHEGKSFHMVYDCEKNRWILLSGGALTEKIPSPGRGLMYDAKRKLVYMMTEDGAVFALRIDPATAKIIDTEAAVSK